MSPPPFCDKELRKRIGLAQCLTTCPGVHSSNPIFGNFFTVNCRYSLRRNVNYTFAVVCFTSNNSVTADLKSRNEFSIFRFIEDSLIILIQDRKWEMINFDLDVFRSGVQFNKSQSHKFYSSLVNGAACAWLRMKTQNIELREQIQKITFEKAIPNAVLTSWYDIMSIQKVEKQLVRFNCIFNNIFNTSLYREAVTLVNRQFNYKQR